MVLGCRNGSANPVLCQQHSLQELGLRGGALKSLSTVAWAYNVHCLCAVLVDIDSLPGLRQSGSVSVSVQTVNLLLQGKGREAPAPGA